MDGIVSLVEMVLQLRAACPAFHRRVGGSAEFNEALFVRTDFDVPYAFCVPMLDTGEKVDFTKGLQNRTCNVAIIVCMDNTEQKDGSGKNPASVPDALSSLQYEVEHALGVWKPVSFFMTNFPEYRRKQHVAMGNSRIWYQLEFEVEYSVQRPWFFVGEPTELVEDEEDALTIHEIFARYNAIGEKHHYDDAIFSIDVPNTSPELPPEEEEELDLQSHHVNVYDHANVYVVIDRLSEDLVDANGDDLLDANDEVLLVEGPQVEGKEPATPLFSDVVLHGMPVYEVSPEDDKLTATDH